MIVPSSASSSNQFQTGSDAYGNSQQQVTTTTTTTQERYQSGTAYIDSSPTGIVPVISHKGSSTLAGVPAALTKTPTPAAYSSTSHYSGATSVLGNVAGDKTKVCVTLTSPKEEETAAVTLEVNNASAVLQNIVSTLANRFPPESVVTIQGGEGSSTVNGYGIAGQSVSNYATGSGKYGAGTTSGYGAGGSGYGVGNTASFGGSYGNGLGIGSVPTGYGYSTTSGLSTGMGSGNVPVLSGTQSSSVTRAVSGPLFGVNTGTSGVTIANNGGYSNAAGAYPAFTGGAGSLGNFATTSSFGSTTGGRTSGFSGYNTKGYTMSNGNVSTTVPSSTGYATTTLDNTNLMRGTSEYYANETNRGGTVISQQQLATLNATGGANGEENVKYVEVEVETEVLKEVKVPVYETVVQEKRVPVVQEKIVEVEDLRIEFVTREVPGAPEYVTQWKDQEKIITQNIDVPKIVQKPVKKTVTKEVPRPVEQIIEQPVKKIVSVEASIPKLRETEQAVVVAQSLRPILRESATDKVTIPVKEWEFTLVHVDVPIPKAVQVQILVGGILSTEHKVVSIGAAQWNSLIRVLNGHLLEKAGYEVFLPYYRQGNLIPFLPNSERMEVISPLSNEWMVDHRQGMYHVTDIQGYSVTTAADIHRLAIEIANKNKQEALKRAEQQWHSQTVTTTSTTTTTNYGVTSGSYAPIATSGGYSTAVGTSGYGAASSGYGATTTTGYGPASGYGTAVATTGYGNGGAIAASGYGTTGSYHATQSVSSSTGTGNIRNIAPVTVSNTNFSTTSGAVVPLVTSAPYPSSRTSNSVRNEEGSYKEIAGQLSHASSYQDLPGHFNTGLTTQS